jgi:large subunit ribosomal protein L28
LSAAGLLGYPHVAAPGRAAARDRVDTDPRRRPEEFTVAATCDVCGKGPGFGNSISHSHRRTSRRWNPNIQSVRTLIGRTPKRLNVCTSCLKAGKVTRA